MIIDIILTIASISIGLSIVPQLYRTYKNRKQLKDISPFFSLLFTIGSFLFAIAFILQNVISVALLNILGGIWTSLSLYWCYKYRKS